MAVPSASVKLYVVGLLVAPLSVTRCSRLSPSVALSLLTELTVGAAGSLMVPVPETPPTLIR